MQNLIIAGFATLISILIAIFILVNLLHERWENFKGTVRLFEIKALKVEDNAIETILELKALLQNVKMTSKQLLEARGPMFESLPEVLTTLQRCINLVEGQALQLHNSQAIVQGLVDQIDHGDAERLQIMLRAFTNKLPNKKTTEAIRRKINALNTELEKLVTEARMENYDKFLDPMELRSEEANDRVSNRISPEQRAIEAEKFRKLRDDLKYGKISITDLESKISKETN